MGLCGAKWDAPAIGNAGLAARRGRSDHPKGYAPFAPLTRMGPTVTFAVMPQPDKFTVLHVITALNHGGAEAMLAKLVLAAARRRTPFRHHVISLMPLGVVGTQLADMGIPVQHLGMRRGLPSLRGLWRLVALVRSLRPDIIQGWMYHGNIAATIARPFAGAAARLGWNIRHSLRDLSRERARSSLAIRLCARWSANADFLIYNSRAAIAEHAALGFANDSALLVPNGFDTELYRPDLADRPIRAQLGARLGIPPQAVIIGMVARVHPMKDHAGLFEAVRQVREAGHDAYLLLAGTGTDPLPPDLAAMLGARLPAGTVKCLGDRRDIPDWLPGLDIAVLSSAWGEGFPNVIGEAMAAGLPCVVTDVGDSREIVGPGGICAAPGDPAALASAMIELIAAGPRARIAMGARGRERVCENFSLERVVQQYDDLYARQLETRGEGARRPLAQEQPSCAG